MRRIKLTRQEKEIENALIKGEYVPVSKEEFDEMALSLASKRKDAVLNIRVNKMDLDSIKSKAAKAGIRYQTLISEILHKVAQTPAPSLGRSIK